MGLIEVVAALTLLGLGLAAQASLTVAAHTQLGSVRERQSALQAARARIEVLFGHDFRTCFAAFDEGVGNDPPEAPGPHFDVAGLQPSAADPDGRVGRIIFPTAPGAGGGDPVLREDLDVPELGLPHDLDGDGVLDSEPKDDTYVHIPVIVEVWWQGRSGEQTLRIPTWITPRR
jgi:type II secretory pathway pseudopilin PulG